jgi:hypothetical protein
MPKSETIGFVVDCSLFFGILAFAYALTHITSGLEAVVLLLVGSLAYSYGLVKVAERSTLGATLLALLATGIGFLFLLWLALGMLVGCPAC